MLKYSQQSLKSMNLTACMGSSSHTSINLQQSKTSSSSLFSTNRLHSCSRALDHGNFSFKRLDHDYSVLHKLVSLVDMEFKILLEEIKSRNYVEVKCIRFW
ncbi:hypothetical protein ACJW30_11G066300 [Castanea mollissima]